ncbi:hypothetical protein [Armatimonas rosea]|uniref:Uncharacterized protein n=1 Tax=Armatimonas rosea TaxID=685828 RepID=A0A7W9W818_ARMRO|nr:hypothetical protein [Armatimonas rosea]MBB6051182.1 hypothetical protein [Armatimonas rosea]
MDQTHSIGDGIIVLALAAAFLGYYYLKFRERQRYIDILHEERLAAIAKDIPLPELPIEPLFVKTARPPDYRTGLLIGVVLLCFGLGAMLTLWLLPSMRSYWPAPLPVAFIGGGLLYAFSAGSRVNNGY